MSRPSIHISIPTPCHESWDSMDATERGAFCHRCQKEVIDFSAMTDREVIEYLEKHKTGCGRFRKDQLNTNLTIPKLDNGIFRWKALFLGFLSLISIKNIVAQSSAKSPCSQRIFTKTEIAGAKLNPSSDTIILSEVSITAPAVKRGTRIVQGMTAVEIQKEIPSNGAKREMDENATPVPKHRGLNWFRRVFRVKKKS